jgi:hypothetical protein
MDKRKQTPRPINRQYMNYHIASTEVRKSTVAEFKRLYEEQFDTYEDVLTYFSYMYEKRIFQLAKSKDRYMMGINKAATTVQTYQSLLDKVDKASQDDTYQN